MGGELKPVDIPVELFVGNTTEEDIAGIIGGSNCCAIRARMLERIRGRDHWEKLSLKGKIRGGVLSRPSFFKLVSTEV